MFGKMLRGTVAVIGIVTVLSVCSDARSESLRDQVFTYQGELKHEGRAADGAYDFEFRLYDAADGGSAVAGPIVWSNVTVSGGVFTLELDFGLGDAFEGERRWLEIGVRPYDPGDTMPYATLAPRQEIMPSPYSCLALNAEGIAGHPVSPVAPANGHVLKWNGSFWSPASDIDTDTDTTYTAGTGLSLSGTQFSLNTGYADGRYVNEGQSNSVTTGMIQSNAVTSAKLASDRASLGRVSGGNMYANSNGLVGVGTSSPVRPLHVVRQGMPVARFEDDGPYMTRFEMKSGQGGTWTMGVQGLPNQTAQGSFWFQRGSEYPFVLAANGNVGIGDRFPGASLEIENYDNQLLLSNDGLTANKAAGIVYNHAAGALDQAGGIVFQRRSDDGAFEANLVTIKLSDGYMGVGVINPAYRLELPNSASTAGRARANRWDTYSSLRWKRDVEPIDCALDKVLALRGVYFNWDEEHGGQHDIGFLAEEVGAVVPELVSWEANGRDAQGLAYDRITALAVEAIKEQQQELNALNEEVAELHARIRELESIIAKQIGGEEGRS